MEPSASTLPAPTSASAPSTRTLLRARVIATTRTGVEVELPDGARVAAELAFTFPYAPQPDDSLLILATQTGHRAIGLLAGAGPRTLSFEGDLELRTLRGPLRLEATERVELDAPRVTLGAKRLKTVAASLRTQADEAFQWVQGLLEVHADDSRRTVEGEDYVQAEAITILARETVKVDGSTVQLG